MLSSLSLINRDIKKARFWGQDLKKLVETFAQNPIRPGKHFKMLSIETAVVRRNVQNILELSAVDRAVITVVIIHGRQLIRNIHTNYSTTLLAFPILLVTGKQK